MGREVTAPGGGRWNVSRRVLVWRPRRRIDFDLDPVGILLGIVALPLLLLEWLLALLVTAILAASSAAGLRSWRVEAVLDGPMERRMTWSVKGWSAAGERAAEVCEELSAGRDPSSHADRVSVRPR